jgi:Flp pilus assembly protein TadB
VNINEQPAGHPLFEWYKGPTLINLIDTLQVPVREIQKPFRFCITDVFKSLTMGVTVAGRVEAVLTTLSHQHFHVNTFVHALISPLLALPTHSGHSLSHVISIIVQPSI